MIEVIFDVETKKFFDDINERDPGKLGISVLSAYRREVNKGREIRGEMRSFFENDFSNMWRWFEEAERIIGFNSLGFDVPAVNVYYKNDFAKLPHFDIMAKVKDAIGRRISLDAIAKETLGKSKLASGADAVEWWARGDKDSLEKLVKYCEMDVEVTRDIYDAGLINKRLKYKDRWNELREVEVDFSYPKIEEKREEQMGLW